MAIATKRVAAIAGLSIYAGIRSRIGRVIANAVLRRGQLRTFTVTPLERPAAKAA